MPSYKSPSLRQPKSMTNATFISFLQLLSRMSKVDENVPPPTEKQLPVGASIGNNRCVNSKLNVELKLLINKFGGKLNSIIFAIAKT